jgi:hypothetical protein
LAAVASPALEATEAVHYEREAANYDQNLKLPVAKRL